MARRHLRERHPGGRPPGKGGGRRQERARPRCRHGERSLQAGLLDEIQIHLVPVLLGEGRRPFEHLGADHIELETVSVARGQDATHLRYRVKRR